MRKRTRVNQKQLGIDNEINRKILGEYMSADVSDVEKLTADNPYPGPFKCNPDESAGLEEEFADFESPPTTPIDGEVSEDGFWVWSDIQEQWVELPYGHREDDTMGIEGIEHLTDGDSEDEEKTYPGPEEGDPPTDTPDMPRHPDVPDPEPTGDN